MNEIRLSVMVARDEDGNPVVCGAWETSILDIIELEEVEAIFAKARADWLPDYVDWREVTVVLDRDKVLASFNGPEVRGEVQPC